jgi:hypothetical protein
MCFFRWPTATHGELALTASPTGIALGPMKHPKINIKLAGGSVFVLERDVASEAEAERTRPAYSDAEVVELVDVPAKSDARICAHS